MSEKQKNNAFIEIEEIYNKKYKNFEISYFITLKLCRTQKLKTDIIYESNYRVLWVLINSHLK